MLRTKLITLACVAALALGISSTALAVPIEVTGTVEVSDFSAGLALYSFGITVTEPAVDHDPDNAFDPFDPESVGSGSGVLVALQVFFDDVVDISETLWSTFNSAAPPAPTTSEWTPSFDTATGCFDGVCDLSIDNFTGVAAFNIFTLNVIVNVGDAISNLGSLLTPSFTFYSCDPARFDSFDCDPFFFDSLFVLNSYNFDAIACEPTEQFCGDPEVPVPEPSTLGLLGLGLLGMGAARRRRKT